MASGLRYATATASGAALGGFLFGFDTSVMNSAVPGIRETLGLDAGPIGLVAAIVLIGCAVGAWFAGPISLRQGRTRVMLGGACLVAGGSVSVALSGTVAPLALSRFVVGLGIGSASAVVPPYIAEIAPTRIRGRLGTLWQFGIVIGQFVGLLAGLALASLAGSEASEMPWGGIAWRWMFLVVALAAVVWAIIALLLPPSPSDLVRLHRKEDAHDLLLRLGSRSPDDRLAQAGSKSGRRDLGALRGPRFGLQPIVWIGLLLAAFQQLVGMNVVKTYSNALWQIVGFSTGSSFTFSLVTVGISIASTVVAIAIVDRIDRRSLLGAGAAVMAVALAALAIVLGGASGTQLSGADAVAALIAMNLFAVAFGVTWGPVVWLMLGELFDSRLRTTAVAVCTAFNWLTNWAVTSSYPLLVEVGLGFTYGLYAMFAALAFLFAWKVLPETRGHELEG